MKFCEFNHRLDCLIEMLPIIPDFFADEWIRGETSARHGWTNTDRAPGVSKQATGVTRVSPLATLRE